MSSHATYCNQTFMPTCFIPKVAKSILAVLLPFSKLCLKLPPEDRHHISSSVLMLGRWQQCSLVGDQKTMEHM